MEKKDLKRDFLIKVAIIIGIIVVINIISIRVFTRIDITKNQFDKYGGIIKYYEKERYWNKDWQFIILCSNLIKKDLNYNEQKTIKLCIRDK